ncbi:MAG: glutamate--tRNA ligase family protein [Hornefia butyriciproducens]|uniref:glutamate--tRNA ligase n=1 Tax=Hornefia butyriciproducens TaxID=2652293 RepID=UPI002A74EB20|nr:glutamate--tRNA ligase family protein [Hornefia butyriciproducens]MDY2991137.1 glutamate--tRNA ligase family protein [Hornefia butyriciproducens]
MDYNRLAELLFPQIQKTPQEYEEMYPPRILPEGAKVTRLGPSPTGFIHLGNLYGAFADERLAHQSGGVFYLRIEDTDDKRYVDGAVETIIDSLRFFGIQFDEGATRSGDVGDYGDYTQSHRGPIYQCFAKKLVSEGKAYPCFLTEQEIGEIRAQQEEEKVTPGIYGRYARCRDWSFEQVQEALQAGRSYVIRLKSDGRESVPEKSGEDASVRRVEVVDAIRGRLTMPENFMDTVILKATGIPTYHFAHVIDDHLMRTTHVVRGAEWLSSLPVHVELFEKLGWEMPVYCHTAQLMKLDEQGNRRKLSKREDPELSLDYYRRQGYHPEAVREYLLTILNSDFEEWRIANPDAPVDEFRFTTEKMSSSGALFDLNKLNDISKDVLLKIPADRIYEFLSDWSREFAPEYSNMFEDREYMLKILDLGRGDKKPRKDLIYARQIVEFISYFFDKQFRREDPIPAEVPQEDVNTILSSYLSTYDHSDDQSRWFDKIREIATELGYAAKPKDFKKHPEEYKGHVGHVSTVIRIALMGRAQSPDVWTIQQIMGEEKVRARISDYME